MKRLKVVVIGALMVLLLALSACGTAAVVQINDDGMDTEVDTKLPRTVKKVLEDAGITLGEKDVVTPSLDTKLQEGESITVEREHLVKLTVEGETKEVSIVGGTVDDLLKQEGITLKEHQITSQPGDTRLANNMEIEVVTQLEVSLTLEGKTEKKNVSATNVGDALTELGVTLGAEDRVEPEAKTQVSDGMEIVVKRVKTEEVTETEAIDYEVSYEYSDAYSAGTEVISREGVPGEKTVKYKVTTVDGEEESKEVVEENVTTDPVTAIVIIGTYEEPAASSSSSDVYVVSKEDFPDCDGSGHGYYHIVYSNGYEEDVDY